jgi:hypothetical protein
VALVKGDGEKTNQIFTPLFTPLYLSSSSHLQPWAIAQTPLPHTYEPVPSFSQGTRGPACQKPLLTPSGMY